MTLEYILAISIQEACCDTYVGTFQNCDQAQSYYEQFYSDTHKGYSCLHQDYIVLPKGFEHKYILVTPEITVTPTK